MSQLDKEFGLWSFAPKLSLSAIFLKKFGNPIPSLYSIQLGFEALESE
jgi:hypothetical protein